MSATLCLIHPIDPRGRKVGGIESHVRETIRSAPAGLEILLVGIDEVGDLRIGEVQEVRFEDRVFAFLPLLRRTGDAHLRAAKTLAGSLTLQFFLAFLRRVGRVRRALRDRPGSVEIQRFEFAGFGRLLGRPSVQIVHGEGSPDQPMDSLLKKFWFVQVWNERIAFRLATRIVGVNARIVQRIAREFPSAAAKTDMLTVSVNTDIFPLTPAWPPMSPFRIGFAGRLDAFKRPDLMFRVLDELRRRHGVAVEFHYAGPSDPAEIAGYERVADVIRSHGIRPARGVAEILAGVHVGILVSEFEGMPVFVLELLASGRPLVALALPQLDGLIEDGVSGYQVRRSGDAEADSLAVADAMVRVRDEIGRGALDPAAIRARIEPFSHRVQLAKLFAIHAALRGSS